MNQPLDIKYLGIPNVCFSLTKPDDDREPEFAEQRKVRGFDDSETWSLRDTFADFMVPRLKVFIEKTCGHPCGLMGDEWSVILNKILFAFELVQSIDNRDENPTLEEWDRYQEGMDLFSKWYMNLWW